MAYKYDRGSLRDFSGNTPLHIAAFKGHLTIINELLDKNKNKNEGHKFGIFLEAYCEIMSDKYDNGSHRDFSDAIPLHLAAFKGHLSIVKELIANLSYKHLKGTGEFTPLHAAACKGHFKVCLEIMKNIEDKNPQDTRGTTPLHYAAYYGHL
jgi:ankyrin repeat protein